MAVYNEEDVLGQNLAHLRAQGINTIVIDNGSTDASASIARSFLGEGVLAVRSAPADRYRWKWLLDSLVTWAADFSPDWCILCDADTFLESPDSKVTLRRSIEEEAARGFNVVRFDNFEFWPTDLDDTAEPDVRRRLKHYVYHDSRQEKAWKWIAGTCISRTGGHIVDFPCGVEKLVSPTRMIMRHYKIRSYEHGLRKVFGERLPRYVGEPEEWHVQYDWMTRERDDFVRDASLLSKYREDGKWVYKKKLGKHGKPLPKRQSLRRAAFGRTLRIGTK
jgi:glycosyltransferase involved in cell wall biosynthesis